MDLALLKKKVRKCKDILATAGYGIIVLVIWDFVKSIIYLSWTLPYVEGEGGQVVSITLIVFAITELLFCIISSSIIIKFGRTDKKVGVGLLIISIVLLMFAAISTVASVYSMFTSNEFDVVIFIIFIEDIIFFVFTVQILYSIIKLMKLSQVIKEHKDEH